MTSIYLKEHGYVVTEVPNLASRVAREALERGKIDLYWEYTGTALVTYYGRPAETDPRRAYQEVKELDRPRGLVWLDRSLLNSTYAILMRRDKAQAWGVSTISDLAAVVRDQKRKLLFASGSEFAQRRDGLPGLQRRYGFAFPEDQVSKMDTGLLYNALKDDQVDVVAGIATDGRIDRFDLVALKDDLAFFPAYTGVPVVRKACLERHPGLEELINRLPPLLDTETMMQLTSLVDVEHEDVVAVVRDWLSRQGLIPALPGDRSLLKQPVPSAEGAPALP